MSDEQSSNSDLTFRKRQLVANAKVKAVQYHPHYCEEARADLAANGRKPWRFDSSHDLSVIKDGKRIKIGQFQCADFAHAVGQLIEEHGLEGL